MQAVAHSPSFAKKAGVSQSVGKDFSAADKGKTFNKGGMMKKGKRFNGGDGESEVEYHEYDPDKTYSGRFTDDETGGLAENTPTRAAKEATPSRAAPAPSRAPAPAVSTSRAPAPAPAPAVSTSRRITNDAEATEARAAGRSSGIQDYITPAQRQTQETEISKREAAEDKKATAQQGRYNKHKTAQQREEGMISEEDAKRNLMIASMLIPGVGGAVGKAVGVRGLATLAAPALRGPELSAAARAMAARTQAATKRAQLATPAGQAKEAQRISDAVKTMAEAAGPKAAREASMARAARQYNEGRTQTALDAWRRANPRDRNANLLAKGGTIMKSKSMKFAMGGDMPAPGGARPDPRMMAAMRAKQAARQQPMRRPPPGGMPPPAQPPMGMKKGGMPMKDGKPAFMQKKMNMGGMAYAKGGGIESRGKTKGTIIRMAAGGSVSSRADGIAQRGKTKFTNY